MDQAFVMAFAESAKKTFRDMFGLDAKALGTRTLDSSDDHGWDLTGLVGLAGQAQGVVAVRLTLALAASLLAGSGVATAGDDERLQMEAGLVGELTNIIAGSATTALKGLNVEIAPPVVVRGPNHKIGWPAIAPVVAVSFGLPEGSFEVDLCVKT